MKLEYWSCIALLVFAATAAQAHDGEQTPGPQPSPVRFDEPPLTGWEASCRLTVRLLDGDTGETRAGVFRVADGTGRRILLDEPHSRGTALSPTSIGPQSFLRMDSWSVSPGVLTVEVPRAALVVEAFRGPNSRMASVAVDCTGLAMATVDVPVALLSPEFDTDWESGNCHLHVQRMTAEEAERYVCETAAGDGYDRVYLSYLERAEADEQYISNTFTAEDLQRFSARSGVAFGYGEEYRHNFVKNSEGYGHVMFLDLTSLILPASLGEAITKLSNDDFGLRPGMERARAQAATILWCHAARGTEDIPNWVAGLVDVQMLFDTGNIGSYGEALYPYLNIGLRVPLATGTDWFFRDMSMTYVQAAEGSDSATWLASLRGGHSFITNGPLVALTVNGEPIGSTVQVREGESLTISARALCRGPFAPLELISNGEVVSSAAAVATDGRYEAALTWEQPAEGPCWISARTSPYGADYDSPSTVEPTFNEYGKPLFAHTSPIYVTVDGREVFVRESAELLLGDVARSQMRIEEEGDFSGPAERAAVLSIYNEAASVLQARLDAAGNGADR